jgi:hypothetical protein
VPRPEGLLAASLTAVGIIVGQVVVKEERQVRGEQAGKKKEADVKKERR